VIPPRLAALFFAVRRSVAVSPSAGGGSARAGKCTVRPSRSPGRSRIASSSELFAICAGGAGTRTSCLSLCWGHFIAGVPGAGGSRTVAMCGTELHPRLRGWSVAGLSSAFRQGALAHCDSGRFGAGDDWTYCCERTHHRAAAPMGDWASFAITATTFAVVYWTRLSPLVVFGLRRRSRGLSASCDAPMNAFCAARPCARDWPGGNKLQGWLGQRGREECYVGDARRPSPLICRGQIRKPAIFPNWNRASPGGGGIPVGTFGMASQFFEFFEHSSRVSFGTLLSS